MALSQRDKKQEILTAVFGEPKKGDYISGKKNTCKVWNGTNWMYHGQMACKSKKTGLEYFTDTRLDTALNSLDEEAIKYLVDNGIIPESDVGYYTNQPLTVAMPDGAQLVRYPSDIAKDETDYMMFKFYEYIPPFGNEGENQLTEVFDPENNNNTQLVNQTLGAYNSSVAFNAKEAEGYKTILLYMPEDIGDAFSAGWEGKAFGNISAGIISSTAGSDNVIDALGGLATEATSAAKRLQVNATAQAITNLAKSITGDTITTGDIFSGAKGIVRNPNAELLFQNMNMRTFDHSFKMSPYNKTDEENIQKIIMEFKRAMLPSYSIGDTDVANGDSFAVDAAFIKVPKLVQVSYMRGGQQHKHLPKYKLCALTDVNISYTPDNNYATFSQGGPVAYELKLNFMETKLVYSEEVMTGNH